MPRDTDTLDPATREGDLAGEGAASANEDAASRDERELAEKGGARLRAGLNRHGLVRRPDDIRRALGRRGLRFSDGNAVELFECGRTAFPRMLDTIASARDFVHLETYLLRADRLGTRFIDALTERADAGVDVRLLYDAVGSHQLDPLALDRLRTAGAEIVVFNPLRRFYPHWAPRRRDHRKLLVVDGAAGFTGGLNIGDEYDAGVATADGDSGWRDSHVGVRGPAVRELGAVFLESWFRAGGAELPWGTLLDVDPGRPGTARCAVLPDGPVYRRRAMRDVLVSALDGVRHSARLTSPYFAPDKRVLDALERAASRGARVELILAGRTDHPLMRRGARSTLERLLRLGVSVYEYTAAVLHAKSAVFDRRYAIVGTSNLDRQSFHHSYEVNLVFADRHMPRAVDRLFDADLERSEALSVDQLAGRSPITKAIDRLAAAAVHGFV